MLDALRARLKPVAHLEAAARVLEWDQETYMPPGAAAARAQQLATLRTMAHEHFVAEETADLLAGAKPNGPLEDALVRVTRRDLERQAGLPSALVRREAEASAHALQAWKGARDDDDFPRFAPHLDRLLAIQRKKADCWGAKPGNRYDPLLETYEPGTTGDDVEAVFAELRTGLVPLIQAVAEQAQVSDAPVRGAFDPDRQWDFGLAVARAFGYDLQHGRQDRSAHPFTTAFSPPYDVRITTRTDPDYFPTAFYGTLHEVGHALYEQGFSPALVYTPLAEGASLGMHESQSRLWENQVGRSRAFWDRHFAEAQGHFPERLSGVSVEAFWKAVNRVEPSLIRVEADELTYHLHVLLRFELERAMVEGDLAARDLPGAWREKTRDYLGVTPETDADGCLQDIHWAMGAFGYFPTYTLGTLMSAQLWDALGRDLAGGDAESAGGAGRLRRHSRLAARAHPPPRPRPQRAGPPESRHRQHARRRPVARLRKAQDGGSLRHLLTRPFYFACSSSGPSNASATAASARRSVTISGCASTGSRTSRPTPSRDDCAGTIIRSNGVQSDVKPCRSSIWASALRSRRKALPGSHLARRRSRPGARRDRAPVRRRERDEPPDARRSAEPLHVDARDEPAHRKAHEVERAAGQRSVGEGGELAGLRLQPDAPVARLRRDGVRLEAAPGQKARHRRHLARPVEKAGHEHDGSALATGAAGHRFPSHRSSRRSRCAVQSAAGSAA